MNTSSTIDLETSQEVFVLNTDGKSSGTANTGTMYIPYGALKYNTPFCLKMTSFNTIFSAPNISTIRGNTMQFDDGNIIWTITLPTGSYSVGGSADLGSRLAALMTTTNNGLVVYTAAYDDATNKYTIKGTSPFRFVFTNPDKKIYCSRQLGFDTTVTQVLATSQTASFVPHFYENEFHIYIEANNAVTDLVSMPRSDKVVRTSFIIPRTADYGGQIYLSLSQLTPQRISFTISPSRLSWNLMRPDGSALEQEFDWTDATCYYTQRIVPDAVTVPL